MVKMRCRARNGDFWMVLPAFWFCCGLPQVGATRGAARRRTRPPRISGPGSKWARQNRLIGSGGMRGVVEPDTRHTRWHSRAPAPVPARCLTILSPARRKILPGPPPTRAARTARPATRTCAEWRPARIWPVGRAASLPCARVSALRRSATVLDATSVRHGCCGSGSTSSERGVRFAICFDAYRCRVLPVRRPPAP